MNHPTGWRTCRICGETKTLDKFYQDRRRNGETRTVRKFNCRDCTRRAMREAYREAVEFLHEYKLKHGCVDCGYKAHPEALDFDHLPGAVKSFTIGSAVRKSKDELLAEIAKCEVVCANCHRVRTRRRMLEDTGPGADWDLRKESVRVPVEVPADPPFEQLQLDLPA